MEITILNSTWTTDPLFMKVGEEYYYYNNDHLGTPQKMIAGNGEVVWSAKYNSFGKAEIDPASTVENNLRFPGQYYDQETGLHYNWHRYYDLELGRYLRPDPLGIKSNVALYSYSDNNPILNTDFSGLIVDKKKCAVFIMIAIDICGKEFGKARDRWIKKLQECKAKGNDCIYCQKDDPYCDKFQSCSGKKGYAQNICVGRVCAGQPEPWDDAVDETLNEACKNALKDIPFNCLKTPKRFPNIPFT